MKNIAILALILLAALSVNLLGQTPNGAYTSPSLSSSGGGGAYPQTVSGTVNSGGIPCFTSTTVQASSAALTANTLVKGGGAGACVANSLVSDNATTLTYPGLGGLTLTNAAASLAIGSTPPACTAGTGFFQCGNEGTIPSPGPASGVDIIWDDSTKHCAHGNFNNVDSGCITPAMQLCGTTSACSATKEINWQIVIGSAPLVTGTPSAVTITGISPAFTSTSSYKCTLSDQTGVATALFSVTYVSGSSFTITGGTALTDVIGYVCSGF